MFYEKWKINGKLTHLKIIFIRCFVLMERILILKITFLMAVRKRKYNFFKITDFEILND